MFRQHSDLFEQQAAVLERIATNPLSPTSWQVEEASPESLQRKLVHENVTALAIKSYESMLQVQKRVDYLERLLGRNGIRRIDRKKIPLRKSKKVHKSMKTAYYWFRQEHGPAIMDEFGAKTVYVPEVQKKLLKMWSTMNPSQRSPYWEQAQVIVKKCAITSPNGLKNTKAAAKAAATATAPKQAKNGPNCDGETESEDEESQKKTIEEESDSDAALFVEEV